MRTRLRMAEEAADALVEFGADDVLELASLRVRLGIVDRKRVLEKPLGQPMTAHDIASAAAASRRQLYFTVLQFD